MRNESVIYKTDQSVSVAGPAGPIESELNVTDGLHAQLHDAIESLERRIDAVLGSNPPEPVADAKKNGSSACILHERIVSCNDTLREAVARISKIRDRVRI